jgi:hypothetical protein
MSMSKKDFIALADEMRRVGPEFVQGPVLLGLVRFCRQQNPQFKEDRWLAYLRGECGPSGGAVKSGEGR